MKATLLVALTLMLTPLSASALTCKPAKQGAGYGSYRVVDSKRCWYPGHRTIAKSRLHWVKPKAVTIARRSTKRPPTNNIDLMYADCVQINGAQECGHLLATGSAGDQNESTVERWANWLRSPWSKFPMHLKWGGW